MNYSMDSGSSAESTLKVGVYFNIFPIFLPISESGGVTKSRPNDPFFYVIYLFLNLRFGQKSVQIYRFWVPSSTFCMYHLILFAVDSSFFTPFAVNFSSFIPIKIFLLP